MIPFVTPTQAQSGLSQSGRGRRTPRVSGAERERAIMQTAERLLEERSLGEISVDDLARGAGISRSSFYFYFSSKDAVVLTLIDHMVDEATQSRDRALERLGKDPVAGWRETIRIFYRTLGSHRAVIRAASDLSATNAEARTLWAQIMEGWTVHVIERIEAERRRGAALSGAEPRALATALLQMNERVMRAIFVEETPAVAEDEVIDTLSHIWLSSIYGSPERVDSG
jgi:TetR/AcrR family transcriptional regulator, ethionamide resistance regulator